jgi:shikimate dehydrogenase
MIVRCNTRLAGVLGWPIAHSRSPVLHATWLQHYDLDGLYLPLAVAPERLGEAVRGLAALGFRGANVTVPHKEAVMAHLDRVDSVARRIGAVNTLVIAADGSVEGRNTDGYGFLANIEDRRPDWSASAGPAVVLGAGGAARAVAVALSDAGAPAIRIVNRTLEKAQQLVRDLGGPLVAVPWAERADALADAALVVNTTTLGMVKQPELELDLAALPSTAVVTDIVYTPLETALLRAAASRGNPTVDGLGMLLHQAVPGFEAWFGRRPTVTAALRQAVLAG